MSKINGLDKMSYAELTALAKRIEQLKIEKQAAEQAAVRERIASMAKEHGFTVQELFGKGRKGKTPVAVKYRDPKNSENTWSGRGRMPRWLVAALKSGRAKKDDFLV